MMRFEITGELIELGQLVDEDGNHGIRILRADGTHITLTGLTRDEVRSTFPLYGMLALVVQDAEDTRRICSKHGHTCNCMEDCATKTEVQAPASK